MHARSDIRLAVHLFERHQLTPTEASRVLNIPRRTLQDWYRGRVPTRALVADHHVVPCGIDLGQFDPSMYCYLLGLYLGDGCISRYGQSLRPRITLDSRYPGIIEECVDAMDAIAQQKRPVVQKRLHSNCVEVCAYWRHWPCVFPQHGAGPKHLRRIELTPQQERLVDAHPKRFLRGLIQSDGWRIIATERKGTYVRRAPRYGFSNMSEDILGLFMRACDEVGVRYTRPSFKQVAVYRKASVALLDEFIGPKT